MPSAKAEAKKKSEEKKNSKLGVKKTVKTKKVSKKAEKKAIVKKAKKAKVKRRGENSFLISVNVGQVNENRNYTGLLAYAVKACGEDFISKIQSGEVT